jgi:predicted HNH restriction endonuclease
MTTEITGYWTFFCNPAKWEIDSFLTTNREYDTYQVNDWYKDSIKPGQLGVIRVGVDNRTKEQLGHKQKLIPGIYSIVEILAIPHISTDVSDFYLKEEDKQQKKLRVKIRYLKNLLNNPLLLGTLKQNSIVNQDKYLIEGFQRSTMPLRKDAFEEIIHLLGTDDQIYNNIEIEITDSIDEIEKLELKYQNASPQVKEVISKRIERGGISSVFKKINNYKCKVCEALGHNPFSFKKTNGEFYVETHHINPVSNLVQGSLGISNLITVCANHHRQFHYGNIKTVENTDDYLMINIDGQVIQVEKKNKYFQ